MADKHPYTSGAGSITQVVAQLRRSFPGVVTAETLKKLSIAPNNESYVLNILKFIGVLDSESKKIPAAATVFNKHDQTEFEQGFAELIEKAYHELFDLHGKDGWTLEANKLISFFRTHDETSDIVGRRQATTFQTLARLAGKLQEDAASPTPSRQPKSVKNPNPKKSLAGAKKTAEAVVGPTQPQATNQTIAAPAQSNGAHNDHGVALTVRIEINLPAGGDKSTYDAIFKSIRENLMNGNGA